MKKSHIIVEMAKELGLPVVDLRPTATGRISTKGPAIQSNTPKTLEAKRIRDAFITHRFKGEAPDPLSDLQASELIPECESVLLPEWAIGRTDGQYVLGAQLPTRDGRRMGNAHITDIREGCLGTDQRFYGVLTDAGTELVMTASELYECFYPPKYVSDVKEVLRKFSRHD